ncbi:TetR/AcrR family transcriptional regulator [Streptomyces fagopyri]|uniref:TetR/AcrR family transcriptional regulator n=1 Tax=Streptomyces fagopyri TaxID=2662397 RepID=UPI0038004DC5
MTPEEAVTTRASRRSPRPRADAARNRDRIVAAARDVFVEHGTEAPLDEIAKRAGIGNATLYRHFADRRSLLRAVVLLIMCRVADHAERAAAETVDSLTALRRFVHDAVDERVGAVCGLLIDGGGQDSAEVAVQCRRVEATCETLMDRARHAGQIRADIGLRDLVISMSQLARPLPGIEYRDADAHRHLDLLLDGLRVPAPAACGAPGGAEERSVTYTEHAA